ncbi:aldehyde dehydrogenase family protein [Aquimarina hainanensis]|uniref:Aldehyde dehydrogenase n=1 Tax=Aquimarina hainanensis TaxID=1578017 RepID=A0ABW5N855_9FLAO
MPYQNIIDSQRQFFNTNATKDISFRIQQLKILKNAIKTNESLLYKAIYKDFKKSDYETYVTELAIIYHDIDLALIKIKKWARKKRVSTGLTNLPGRSYILPEPKGVALVIGAWNYPYQLSLSPVVAAISAGCTIVLKPSEIAANASAALAKIITQSFPPSYFKVIEGGVRNTTELLKVKFDTIFFTGSTKVGKIIYEAAAKQLTPVILELGGKSPAIVTAGVDIDMTAKRIVWAKFLNAGQTCIAPDYILVEKKMEAALLVALKKHIEKASYSIDNRNYTQIINENNLDRLITMIDQSKIYLGGKFDKENRIIEPTIMNNVSFDDLVMQEEIFGPILPVISYEKLTPVLDKIKTMDKPLSCYIFTKNKNMRQQVLREISFGGGAINDALVHFIEDNLPFGGVGSSGIGSYHGEYGFKAFSHYKSVLHKTFLFELNLKYAPYTSQKLAWIKKLIG